MSKNEFQSSYGLILSRAPVGARRDCLLLLSVAPAFSTFEIHRRRPYEFATMHGMAGSGEVENGSLLANDSVPGRPSGNAANGQAPLLHEFRAELNRVLQSESLGHSESMKKLLAYLGEKSLNGGANALKEYTIGVEAFNKPPDYDPQLDPAVRVAASKLRHKLENYYLKEGSLDPVRIEMPRGHFALKFSLASTEHPVSEVEPLRAALRKWRLAASGLAVVAAVSVLASLYLGWGSFRRQEISETTVPPLTPELQMIWGPFLKGDRPVKISLGTPMFTKFKRGFYRNSRINDETQAAEAEELKSLQKLLGSPFAVPSYSYTGAGEAIGAFRLGRFLHGRVENISLVRGSTLSWDDIRLNNVVFVGPPKFNLHLYDIPVADGFVIHDGAIRNPKMRPGEKDAYRNSWASNETDLLEDYALVSKLRGLHGNGEIMALGAGSTEGTWAAVEYVTQPEYAKDLVSRVGRPGAGLPDCYQVVIHVKFKQQVPVEISYVTHRVLPPPWLTNVSKSARAGPGP